MTWGLEWCINCGCFKKEGPKTKKSRSQSPNNAVWGLRCFSSWVVSWCCEQHWPQSPVSVYSFIMKFHLVEADSSSQGSFLWTKALQTASGEQMGEWLLSGPLREGLEPGRTGELASGSRTSWHLLLHSCAPSFLSAFWQPLECCGLSRSCACSAIGSEVPSLDCQCLLFTQVSAQGSPGNKHVQDSVTRSSMLLLCSKFPCHFPHRSQ